MTNSKEHMMFYINPVTLNIAGSVGHNEGDISGSSTQMRSQSTLQRPLLWFWNIFLKLVSCVWTVRDRVSVCDFLKLVSCVCTVRLCDRVCVCDSACVGRVCVCHSGCVEWVGDFWVGMLQNENVKLRYKSPELLGPPDLCSSWYLETRPLVN